MTVYLIVTVGLAALFTFLTRAFPFLIFAKSSSIPPFAEYLGKYLPYCVMAVLVVYCLRSSGFSSLGSFLPQTLALCLTVLLHLRKRNYLLSIAAGTLCYMLLIQYVF